MRLTFSILPICSIVNPAIRIESVSCSTAVNFIFDTSPSKAVMYWDGYWECTNCDCEINSDEDDNDGIIES